MTRSVSIDELEPVLRNLSYPLLRPDAAVELQDVTLVVGARERNLGELVSETGADTYRSPADLAAELAVVAPGVDAEDVPTIDG